MLNIPQHTSRQSSPDSVIDVFHNGITAKQKFHIRTAEFIVRYCCTLPSHSRAAYGFCDGKPQLNPYNPQPTTSKQHQ